MTKAKSVMYHTMPCVYCGREGEVEVEIRGLTLWKSGEIVQKAFPNLSTDIREQLISGTHPECWYRMFPNESREWD